MANVSFTVNADQIKSVANQIANQANTFETTANEMIAAIESLQDSVWTGSAKNRIMSNCTQFKSGIKSIKSRLEEDAKELRTVAINYASAEAQNLRTANAALNGNVIK